MDSENRRTSANGAPRIIEVPPWVGVVSPTGRPACATWPQHQETIPSQLRFLPDGQAWADEPRDEAPEAVRTARSNNATIQTGTRGRGFNLQRGYQPCQTGLRFGPRIYVADCHGER